MDVILDFCLKCIKYETTNTITTMKVKINGKQIAGIVLIVVGLLAPAVVLI